MIKKLIYRESCPSGDGNIYRALLKGPQGQQIEMTIVFTHYPAGPLESTWMPAQWCVVDADPHVPIADVETLLGKGDEGLGADILNSWIQAVSHEAWNQWIDETLENEREALWERSKFTLEQLRTGSRF